MNPDIDLRGLSLARSHSSHSPPGGPGRWRWPTRFALPLAVLAGFGGLAAWTARERLLPRHPVTVSPVVASGGAVAEDEAVLFQAAGWVEPEPFPLLVTPLAAGVVKSVDVLEGQPVAEGQVVARLVEDDARIAVGQAEAELRVRQAERRSADAALAAARTDWENPVDLRRDLAAAQAAEVRLDRETAQVRAAVAEAEAEAAARRLEFEVAAEQTAKGIQGDRPRQAAALALRKAEAARESAAAKLPVLAAQAEAAGAETAAARERLRLRSADKRRVAEAEAAVEGAEAKVAAARAALEAAELQLRRMAVKAPCAGVVLARAAVPGTRVGMPVPGESMHAAGLVSLYDPERLQVRVDVPLEHVGKVRPDAKCRIAVEAVPGREFDGVVLRSTSLADIQKNTLQAKVRILSPDRLLRPDMIARIRFTAPPGKPDAAATTVRLLVPQAAVEKGEGGASVWVVDGLNGTAVRRSVTLGRGRQGESVEVVSGLTAADKVVVGGREGLAEGTRVRITEGD